MKQILIPVILIVIIILGGTFGYMFFEKWKLLDALYMTIITISTVGFHEVSNLGIKGRIFTVFLIILGIGVGIKKFQNKEMIVNLPGEMMLEEGDVLVAPGNSAQIDKLTESSQKKGIMDIS